MTAPALVALAEGVADFEMQDCDASPVVGRVAQPETVDQALDDAAFAVLPCYRSNAGQCAQRTVISPAPGHPRLGEHGGEDDPSGLRSGAQDGHVALFI